MTKNAFRSMKIRLSIICFISLSFLLMYTGGVEQHVSVLAGAHSGSGWERLFGFCYIVSYILMIALVPILLISIPVTWLSNTWNRS